MLSTEIASIKRETMQYREKVEASLLHELRRTQEIYERQRKQFTAVISEMPTGIPYLDSQTAITNARSVTSSALESYSRALRNFNDFVLNGVVPEDLKEAEE